MKRSYLMTIGWLLAMVLMLHAAMLAGGSHQTEAHEPMQHEGHHSAVSMQVEMAAPGAPALTGAEMSECALLGVAALRFEAIVPTSAARQTLDGWRDTRELHALDSARSQPRSRAELQVYLI